MASFKLAYIKKLDGGISKSQTEELIEQLLEVLDRDSVEWHEGAEALSDLLALREDKWTPISKINALQILSWIDQKYDSSIFEDFPDVYMDGDAGPEKLVYTLQFTINVLFQICEYKEVKAFVVQKWNAAINPMEKEELNYLHELVSKYSDESNSIDAETRELVVQKANAYFQREYDSSKSAYVLCGLKETITEHQYCYTIGWALKSEKYVSGVKRERFAGGGQLMISKINSDIEMAGSNPSYDWVQEFETRIRGLETYWEFSFPFEKKHLSKYKSILKLNTMELLKMSKTDPNITIEDEESNLRRLYEAFKGIGIDCKLEMKERQKES